MESVQVMRPRPDAETSALKKRVRLWAGLAAVLPLLVIGSGPARAEGEPGKFAYYALALSWSPSHCATRNTGGGPNEPQCVGDRPYSFVLHGLWPQYERGWPSDCQTGERPWVPDEIIREMLDIMPSKRLIIHEYRKHGVCSGLNVRDYFSASRKAYEAVKVPARFNNPQDVQTLSPEEIESEFLKANPQMTADMISVDCKDRRLRDMRICFTRDLKLRACGDNERQEKLCNAQQIVMPPVRTGTAARQEGAGSAGEGQQEGNDEDEGEDDENGGEE
jgi:ribonuclease T2